MQAAEMRGTRAVYDLVVLISLSVAYVHSYPLQVLPVIPGYIPVYIRHGDQPLEEINLALAEAFHEGPNLSKVNSLAKEEKEDLKNLKIDIEEEIKNLDNTHDSNLSKSSSDELNQKNDERIFNAIKMDDRIITDDSTTISKNLPRHLTEEALTTPFTINDKSLVKEQPVPNIVSNVQKLSHLSKILSTSENERTEDQSRNGFEVKMII
ncbi:hypothetical protein QLX08_000175 [Tetragonisca angustula]|uniref:Uncharacterized protein n=1 Tax=Tetragonisca angustula TaxID=166442 RepID=A0AAW1AK58_9HYME